MIAGVLVAAGAALFQAGCASVKVAPETAAAETIKLRAPSAIYIQPFDTSSGMWQGRAREPAERVRVRDWLIALLEKELSGIARTELLAEGATLPASGWMISGRFVRVNPGSKFKRMFIGLGAGGSKLEMKINVHDLAVSSSDPVLTLVTTGGSNMQMGPHTVMSNATTNDIERTAREISVFISDHIWPEDTPSPGGVATEETSLPPVELPVSRESGGLSPATGPRG